MSYFRPGRHRNNGFRPMAYKIVSRVTRERRWQDKIRTGLIGAKR